MPLHVHVADGAATLADALAELLAQRPGDPFAEEVVVVPAKGVERWLTQRLAHRLGRGERAGDGVTAGVRFLSPRSLQALVTGEDQRDDPDPWDPDRLVWPLLAVVDDALDEPWCAALARHVGHRPTDPDDSEELLARRRDRRFPVVRRVAGLLSSYARQRPGLLADWSDGRPEDGAGRPLADDLAWQAELWRRVCALRAERGVEQPRTRHARVLDAVRDPGAVPRLDLPDRLSLFGHTRLSPPEVELVDAVARHREVHLWLPVASTVAWTTLAPHVGHGAVRREDDDSARHLTHPLLRSLGRDARELQRTLAPVLAGADVELVAPSEPDTGPRQDLLGWLRADLRADTVPTPAQREARAVRREDTSVQVHACHGLARQVEVLRDVLVGLLEDDPTLEPRDVLVMCPDVEAVAPLFSATFGLAEGRPESPTPGDAHPAHQLRVRLADRGLAATNPLLALADQVLGLVGGRATVSELVDLLAAEPVRRRFRMDEDDVATATEWLVGGGVRWGISEDLRDAFRLGGLEQNTWAAGLDRLLLGVTMAEAEGPWEGRLPLDDVGSAAVDLAGRVAEALHRLETAVRALGSARHLADWVRELGDAVDGLGAVAPGDEWQEAQLRRELSELLDEATDGDGPELTLGEVRALVRHRLAPRPTRANFRTGSLTVATLVPMRSVPHRVVCLVGLDDGVFPGRPRRTATTCWPAHR